jgi:hypothetical protein
MQEYEDFPPYQYFISVLKDSPQSALLYIDLWKNIKLNSSFKILKDEIRITFLISPTLFRNLLMPLIGLGLASVKEYPSYFTIELVDYDSDFFENNES